MCSFQRRNACINQYITGTIIKELREKNLTQAELAEKLYVSDKTISKWENGKGYPDISLLDPIAKIFGISIAELLSGRPSNINPAGNMMRSKFYVRPVCGNAIQKHITSHLSLLFQRIKSR